MFQSLFSGSQPQAQQANDERQMEEVQKGHGSYEVVEEWVYVGPGKGDYSIPVEQHKQRRPGRGAAATESACINSPEQVARGEGFFRKGAVTLAVFKAGLCIMAFLLVAGFVCLGISFFAPPSRMMGSTQVSRSMASSSASSSSRRKHHAGHQEGQEAQQAHGSASSTTGDDAGSRFATPSSSASSPKEDKPGVEDKEKSREVLSTEALRKVELTAGQCEVVEAMPTGSEGGGLTPEQQTWCCEHHLVACPEFDCKAELDSFKTGWSSTKRRWCCRYHALGCTFMG